MPTEPFNHICKHCGHPRCAHDNKDKKIRCYSMSRRDYGHCSCKGFEMDNLRYLEMKACDE